MKHRSVLVAVSALLASACSSGDTPAAETVAPVPSTTPGAPANTEPPPTGAPPTTVADDRVDDTSAWVQLELLRADPTVDELDLALAEFSALFAPVPGGQVVAGDDTMLPSATHVLEDLDRLRDRLTPEQQAFVDEQVDAVFGEAAIIDEFTLYPDESAVRGFRSPVSSEMQLAVRSVADSLRSLLGGPPLKVHVVVVDGSSLGTAGAQNLSLGPDSSIREGYADDGLDIDCQMQLRDRETTSAEFRGIIVHELVHCWHFTRIGLDVARLNATDDWMKEGIAAYAGELIGGTTRFSSEWWTGYTVPLFDIDRAWPLYSRTYDAIGFWSRIAEQTDVWDSIRAAVDASPNNAAMFDAAVAGLGDGVSWLAAGTVQQPAWGGGWTATGPNMPDRARGMCECPDGTPAFPETRTRPGDVELTASLVGRSTESTTLGVAVHRFDPDTADCEEPTPTTVATTEPETGGNMSGTWRAQPDSIAFMFEQASVFGPEAPAIDVGAVTGDLLMTFDEGGTGTLEYRDVTLFLVDSPLSDLAINGGGTFDWTVEGGRTIISATEYVISVGSSALGEPLTIGSDDLPGGGTTALAGVQAGDELTITAATGSAGAVFFPIIWRRV
ncbi:MAG: hypothetical protein R8G01_17925 [Ilumatobacteraceae bacterium]|nr:hypothetical protein [Ilumatobacteraceae bacterium]